MVGRWITELWQTSVDDIFALLTRLEEGFITGPVVPLLASVGITDYRTVLSSHHRTLYRQVDGNTVVYAVAADAGFPDAFAQTVK